MGTINEKDSQSDTDKQTLNDFTALATAMQEGKMDEVNRLMAAEDPSKEPEEAPEEEVDTPDPELETPKEEPEEEETPAEDAPDKKEETPLEPDKGAKKEPKEAAKPAASTEKPDDVLEELKKQLHRAQSDAGRVPYLQRQLQELQRELRAQRARATEDASDGKKAPIVGKIDDVELDSETEEKIEALRKIDPIQADALERVAKTAMFHANTRVDHAVQTLTEEEQRAEDQRFYIEQKAILTSRIPQADSIFASPEWKQWKESLTPGYRSIAESPYASEVEQAIRAFAADMQRLNGGQAAPVQNEETPPVQENTELKEARERKKVAAVDPKSSTARTTKPFDEKAIFEEFYNDIGKRDNILPR